MKKHKPASWSLAVLAGHRRAGDTECSCGAVFRSRTALGRHRQKWNAKPELQEAKLARNRRPRRKK